MGSRIGIDWGKARIGVAQASAPTWLAFPVETVAGSKSAVADVARIVREYEPDCVYVGLPLTLDGQESFAAQWVIDQAKVLARAIAPIEVRMFDERLTTSAASKQLRRAGRTAKSSRAIIDQAAAVEILGRALAAEKIQGGLAGSPLTEGS